MEKFKKFFAGTNRRLRITSAVIMLLLAYLIVRIGFWGVSGLLIIISNMMIYEFDKMLNKKLGLKFVWDILSITSVLSCFCLNRVYWHFPNYYFSYYLFLL